MREMDCVTGEILVAIMCAIDNGRLQDIRKDNICSAILSCKDAFELILSTNLQNVDYTALFSVS